MSMCKLISLQSISSENKVSQGGEFSSELSVEPLRTKLCKTLDIFMEVVIKWILLFWTH